MPQVPIQHICRSHIAMMILLATCACTGFHLAWHPCPSHGQPCEAAVCRVLGCCMQKEGVRKIRSQHSRRSWRRVRCSRPPCTSLRHEHLRADHPLNTSHARPLPPKWHGPTDHPILRFMVHEARLHESRTCAGHTAGWESESAQPRTDLPGSRQAPPPTILRGGHCRVRRRMLCDQSMAACREEQGGLHACINVCCMLCRLYPEGLPGPVDIDALLQQDAGCISGFASQLQVGIQMLKGSVSFVDGKSAGCHMPLATMQSGNGRC